MPKPAFRVGDRVLYKPDAAAGLVLDASSYERSGFTVQNYLVQWDDGEATDWAPGEALCREDRAEIERLHTEEHADAKMD